MNSNDGIGLSSNKIDEICSEIDELLDILKKNGVDISNYQIIYNKIKQKSISKIYKIIDLDYEIELQHLKDDLNNLYNEVKINNVINFLDFKLKENDIDEDEIQKFSSDIYKVLSLIRTSSDDKLKEKCYKIAYEVLKLELTLIGESKLFELTKDNSFHIQNFSRIIKQEIDEIKNEEDKKIVLKKLYELASDNTNTNYYYRLDLINILNALESVSKYKSTITKDVNGIIRKVNNNNKEIKDKKEYFESKVSRIKKLKKIINDTRKNLLIRAGIFTLPIGLLVGGSALFYNNRKVPIYEITYERHNADTDEITYYSEETELLKKENVDVYLNVENDFGSSDYLKFTISDAPDFDNIDDYVEYLFNGIEEEEFIDAYKGIFISGEYKYDISQRRYKYYLNHKYEIADVGKYYDSKIIGNRVQFTDDDILFIWPTICLIFGYFLFLIVEWERIDVAGIKPEIQEIKKLKRIIKSELISMKRILDTFLNTIKENEELYSRFYTLYIENIHLIKDPDALIDKIKELEAKTNEYKNNENVSKARKLTKKR